MVEQACEALVGPGTLTSGSFVDVRRRGGRPPQYCHSQVLALVKRRTLALLRKGVEPVEQVAFARFLAEWQGIGSGARGADAVLATLEQLAGYPLPASAVESMILPARVADYAPAMLDELTSTGEVFWVGDGPIGDNDGWVRWFLADLDPTPATGEVEGHRARELLAAFAPGGAYFFDHLLPVSAGPGERDDYVSALWQLVWAGLVTGDTFGAVRNQVAGGSHRRPARPTSRSYRSRSRLPRLGRPDAGIRAGRTASPTTLGRWSLVPHVSAPPAARLATDLFGQLDRYGVLTRGSVLTENLDGGFGLAYRALSGLEESGQCRRGYFVEGLGAAQFALTGAVDRLRAELREPEEAKALILAACDPANPYGAALPWPEREGHRPGRKAGALVALVNGRLVLYVERGGRTLLSFTDDVDLLDPATQALARVGPARSTGTPHGRTGRRRARLRIRAPEPGAAGRRLPDDAAGPASEAVLTSPS